MAHEVNVVVGSGLLASQQPISPLYSFGDNTFPIPNARDSLRNQRADAVAIVNPAEFSIGIGGRNTQEDISGVATEIVPSPLEFRRAIVLHNSGPSVLYFGFSAAVTTSDGFPLAVSEKIAIDLVGNPNTRIWVISGGSSDLRILELA